MLHLFFFYFSYN